MSGPTSARVGDATEPACGARSAPGVAVLWLVRHPTPDVAPGVCYGQWDVPALTAATMAAAARLHARLPRGARVVTSPAVRSRALAATLQALRPTMPQPQVDARLAELDFGAWEGQPWSAIPVSALDVWCADFVHHRPGGGESVAALLQRVRCALRDALTTPERGLTTGAWAGGATSPSSAEVVSRTGPLVWITHAGVIRAVRFTLRHGWHGVPKDARQWPTRAPAHGAWLRVPLWRLPSDVIDGSDQSLPVPRGGKPGAPFDQ